MLFPELLAGLSVAAVLVLWFDTSFIVEYGKLLRLQKLLKLDEYHLVGLADPRMTYLQFLREYWDCFFVRLISCYLCLGFWLALPATYLFTDWASFLSNYMLGLLAYRLYLWLTHRSQ